MTDVFTTDDLTDDEKEDILADIKPQIEACNLEREARTCDTCKNTIRLSDTNTNGIITLGTFTGWKGAPSSEIDGFYCMDHKPDPEPLLESDDGMPTFRNKVVVVTVTAVNNEIKIQSIDYADKNPL